MVAAVAVSILVLTCSSDMIGLRCVNMNETGLVI